jgi:hypothetical protein
MLSNPQFVDSFQHRSALPANHCPAITAHQWLLDRLLAGGAVKIDFVWRIRHRLGHGEP